MHTHRNSKVRKSLISNCKNNVDLTAKYSKLWSCASLSYIDLCSKNYTHFTLLKTIQLRPQPVYSLESWRQCYRRKIPSTVYHRSSFISNDSLSTNSSEAVRISRAGNLPNELIIRRGWSIYYGPLYGCRLLVLL